MTDTFTPSYYDILGISDDADTSEVRRAYRRRAQAVHPDAGGGSTDGFIEVTEAYETLIDQDRRRVYDSYLIGLRESRRMRELAVEPVPVQSVDSTVALLFDAPDVSDDPESSRPARGGRRGGWRRRIQSAKGRSH